MTPIRRSDGVPPSGGGGPAGGSHRPFGGRGRPAAGRDVDADPDPDGVALAAATATGVFLGPRFAGTAAWIAAACCLAVACLTLGGASRLRDEGTGGAVVGVLVLGALLASGAAAASVRATAVRGGILVGRAGQPARVEVAATVAEEPRRTRYGGSWVVLTVTRVELAGRTFRTRERAGIVLYPDRLPAQQFEGQPGAGRPPDADRSAEPGPSEDRLAVGDRLRVRASVAAARWRDPLGRQPPVVLRHPVVEGRAPPRGAVLRLSERVREVARRQALGTLAPERAALLVGMALGDTSLPLTRN